MASFRVHVLPQGGQAAQQPVAGEPRQPPIHQGRHLGRIHPHQRGGGGLGQTAVLDGLADMAGQLGLGQFLFGFGHAQVSKHVAAALDHLGVSLAC